MTSAQPAPTSSALKPLCAEGLIKRFGEVTALNGITLELNRGECLGLLGPNGAGKSTLIRSVVGRVIPDAGTVSVFGSPAGSSGARAALGWVPQGLALYPRLTCGENLESFCRYHGLGGDSLRSAVARCLEWAVLVDRAGERVSNLSGGMKRRLNMAAGLIHEPRLMLMDEPTVGVDPQSRNAIFDYLQQLNRGGVTIIYSTHYMEEAERLCSRIGIIDHGKILALGSLGELLTQLPFEEEIIFPATPETAPLAVQLATHGEVSSVNGTHRFRPHSGYPLSAFFTLTESRGLSPRLFESQRPTLEALFLRLTGRTLRDV
jgi:ABC-2 type transport system ATP-binding protein